MVSILIPVYNVESYLPQCLDSVLSQTYPHLQVVLIDDGSQDRSWSVMQTYAQRDTRVEIYHQDNQGVAYTRNHLLEKIKGDYVLFVDSDDFIEPDMVEFLLKKANVYGADVSTCAMVVDDNPVSSRYIETILDRDTAIQRFLFHKELRGSLWNKLVKTNLLHNEHFHCEISYGEDALFCWAFLQKADKVLLTNRQLYHYRMNGGSLSHGTFGPKKMSGHTVWETICKDTAALYPQYLSIAQARHCIEDTLLLRDAAHCGCNDKEMIITLQSTIRQLRHCLHEVDITSIKMRLYALVASHSYTLARLL